MYGTFAELVAVDPVVPLAAEVNAGGVVSWTVTLKPPAGELSLSLVHVTGVVPIGKVPGGGEHDVSASGV